MSHRKQQIESLLKRAVASVLQKGLADPRIKGLVSVTKVEVSVDLRHAAVYVSVTPVDYESRTLHGLRDATRHIQKKVNKAVALRIVPHLEFRIDQSLKREAEVLAAINEGMRRTEANTPVDVEQDAEQDAFEVDCSDAVSSETTTDKPHPTPGDDVTSPTGDD